MPASEETLPMFSSRNILEYDTFEATKLSSQTDEGEETFTVQEAIDALGFGRYQIKITALAGLCYMADSMEIMMLSVLAPALKCTFSLNNTQEALLSTAVFLGMCLMSSCWGILSDKFGRRVALLLFAVLTGYFGLLSSLSPSYNWVLVTRFMVGCGLAATPQSMTYYSEFLSKKSRGSCILAIAFVWAAGSCLEVMLAIFVLPTLGWRWLLVFSSLPLLLFAATYKFLPESPHYLVALGRYRDAIGVLQQIAESNGRALPSGTLRGPNVQNVEKGRFRDLFVPSYLKITFLVSIVMMSSTVSYYGTALLTTALFEHADGCHGYELMSSPAQQTCLTFCQSMSTSDYTDLLITTVGDMPGIVIAMVLMAKLGRKAVLCLLMSAYSVVMALCNICAPRMALVAMLFIARALINGAAQAAFVYVAEVFPTYIRATGMGWSANVGRIGVMVTPFIAQVLIQKSAFLPISAYSALGLVGALAAIILPVETQNRDMETAMEDKGA